MCSTSKHELVQSLAKRLRTALFRKAFFPQLHKPMCVCYVLQEEVKGSVVVALLLKLQRRVAELEQGKMNLQREWDSREEQLQQEQFKVQIHCSWNDGPDC